MDIWNGLTRIEAVAKAVKLSKTIPVIPQRHWPVETTKDMVEQRAKEIKQIQSLRALYPNSFGELWEKAAK